MTQKPHLVFDARLYGPQHTGIGRYIKNLLSTYPSLPLFKSFRFTLIVDQKEAENVKKDLGKKFNYLPVNIPHYSFKEQLLLPLVLNKLKPSLVHFPHFNSPLFWFKPSLVTLHDLIKHQSRGKQTTTRSPTVYWLKFLAYTILTKKIITQNHLIVPSFYWKDFLVKKYKKDHKQITVTHEAVDPDFAKLCHQKNIPDQKFDIKKPYLVYTGNLYPHKNIDLVLKTLLDLPRVYLYICSKKNIFWQETAQKVKNMNLTKQVKLLDFPSDQTVVALYKEALALVHPSKIEGFGLTVLEAMNCSCPVLSSSGSCLPEVYGPAALYFNPDDHQKLTKHIKLLLSSSSQRKKLINLGQEQIKKYSWSQTAHQTLFVYQKLLKR
jgi:glycosyltransferase involved in cell wall biosynthesis